MFSLCLVGMVTMNVVYDPLHILRAPEKNDVYDRQARFGHTGIVRHTTNGDVFIGSSVFQDLDESVYQSLTSRGMTRLPVPGASPVELYEVTDTLLSHHAETIDKVVLGMDFFVWGKDAQTAKWDNFPQDLYSDIPFVPVNYAISFQTFSRLIRLMPDYYVLDGRERTYNTRYRATYAHDIGRKEVFQHACKILDKKKIQVDGLSYANVKENIQRYLMPLVNDYPNTEFVFLLPTYSLLEYAQYQEFGKLDDFLKFREKLGVMSLNDDQITVSDAQTDVGLMQNLDVFYDATHGGQEVLDSFFSAPTISNRQQIYLNSGQIVRAARFDGRKLYDEMTRSCS